MEQILKTLIDYHASFSKVIVERTDKGHRVTLCNNDDICHFDINSDSDLEKLTNNPIQSLTYKT